MFKSPQTGSFYEVVGKVCKDPENRKDSVRVCYRPLDDVSYRVRIQGDSGVLNKMLVWLPSVWGHIKDSDHLSVVVHKRDLGITIADAMKATVDSYLLDLPLDVCTDIGTVEIEFEEEDDDYEDDYEDEDGF